MKDGPFLEQNPLSENLLARNTIPFDFEIFVGKRRGQAGYCLRPTSE